MGLSALLTFSYSSFITWGRWGVGVVSGILYFGVVVY